MATKYWLGTDSGNEGDVNVNANWVTSTGAASTVPANGDDIIFDDRSSEDADLNLSALSAVVLNSLTITQGFTGNIGTHSTGVDTFLEIQSATVDIGQHYGNGSPVGSGRLLLDLGATACNIRVHNSKTGADETNAYPIRLKTNSASSKLYVNKGNVEYISGTISGIYVSYVSNVQSDSAVIVRSATLTTFDQNGGTNICMTGATTVNVDGGKLILTGLGAVTTANVYGGSLDYRSTGTITNLNCYGGTTDFRRDLQAKTVTNATIYKGAILDVHDAVTRTNGVDLAADADFADVQMTGFRGATIN
jgi:hypothetical protein